MDSVEVHTRRQFRRVELHFVVSGLFISLDKKGDLLPERIEDCESDARTISGTMLRRVMTWSKLILTMLF